MNPWNELDQQAASLQSWQLLLMLVFLLGYAGTIGGLLEPRGRLRSAAIALFSGVALCLLVAPWVLGALMLAAAVGAVGLFTGLVVLLSRLLGVDQRGEPEHLAAQHDDTPEAARRGSARPRAAGPLTVT